MTQTTSPAAIAAISLMLAAIAFAPKSFAQDAVPAPRLKPAAVQSTAALALPAKIGFARLEKGRLSAAPLPELIDWASLQRRTADELGRFSPISPAFLARVTAQNIDSDNKIDEIRMIAAEQNMRYVVIYSRSGDEGLSPLALERSGLTLSAAFKQPATSQDTAVLVESYSGAILGTISVNPGDEGLTELTSEVEALLYRLGGGLPSA